MGSYNLTFNRLPVIIAVFTMGVAVLLLLFTTISYNTVVGRKTVFSCEGSSLSLSCKSGTVISIIRANYGRFSNTVCPNNNKDKTLLWDTRCIQPTSLRVVSSLCQGEQSCSIPVSSRQFGDPCPGTQKYLELVYTCMREEESINKTPELPPWLINLESITNMIFNKQSTVRPITSTTELTTTTTASTSPLVRSRDYIRRPSPEFLLYIKQVEEEKMKKRMKALKEQKQKTDEEKLDEENTIMIAMIIAIIGSIFIIIFSIAIILYQKSCRSIRSVPDTDIESTTSTYLHYSTHGSDYSCYGDRTEEPEYQSINAATLFSSSFAEKSNCAPYETKARFPHENDYVYIDTYFRKL